MNDGFILLHRKMIKEWEWYNNINDTRLWIHCLLSANWVDGWFEGIKIERGSFVTSLTKLSIETGLSVRSIRTSLNHLKSTNNLTINSNNKFSIITINNYKKYQIDVTQKDRQPTGNRQATDNNIINNNKEQIKTMNNNKYNNVDFESEFEDIWKLYPNKQGKSNALKSYIKARKSGIDKETILNGLNNYLDYIKFNKVDNQYIKHGSTWFNQQCWNDIYNMQKTLKQKTNNIFEELLQEEKNEKRTNIIDVEYTEKSIS